MIGGSLWRISTAVGEDVVYAVDYNHRKELHLNSTSLSSLFSRPALMIADADRSVHAVFFYTQTSFIGLYVDSLYLVHRENGNMSSCKLVDLYIVLSTWA